MTLLALLHSPAASGGDTTIRRIADHLVASGFPVLLVREPADHAELASTAKEHDVLALVGTHVLLSGRAFLGIDLPYVLVLGGTDVNEYALEPEFHAVMTAAVDEAAVLVAFNDDFVRRSRALWPRAADKVRLIPQSVRTRPSAYSLRRALGVGQDVKLLLLPSGLRPVKDPLFAIDCVRRLHDEDPRVLLVIAGVSYDEDYEGIVRRRCETSPAVRYVGALDRDDLHAAMREAVAVLNTSTSECSPNSLLEAMDVGCPVVVRDIPGNTCLVEDGVTGLVFADRDGFRAQVRRLLDDEVLAKRLRQRGQEFVRRHHSPRAERAAYAAVFGDLVDLSWDVPVRDVTLCVQTFGDPGDPAILLVAGAGASMLSWDTEFCELLAGESRYVIRYDQRDTGRATTCPPGEPPYTLRDLAADAVGVLDVLGIAHAHVVGISLGGMVAQELAVSHPARVDRLVLACTTPGGANAVPFPEQTVRLIAEAARMEPLVALRRFVENALAPGASEELVDEIFALRVANPPDPAGWQAQAAASAAFDGFDRLQSIAAPTLVLHGTEDQVVDAGNAPLLAARIPNARLEVLEGAGHLLFWEQPERFAAAVTEFLR